MWEPGVRSWVIWSWAVCGVVTWWRIACDEWRKGIWCMLGRELRMLRESMFYEIERSEHLACDLRLCLEEWHEALAYLREWFQALVTWHVCWSGRVCNVHVSESLRIWDVWWMIRRRLSASHSDATSLLYLVQLLHILLGLGMLLLQPLLPHELLVSFEFFSFEEEALLFSHHQNQHVTKMQESPVVQVKGTCSNRRKHDPRRKNRICQTMRRKICVNLKSWSR